MRRRVGVAIGKKRKKGRAIADPPLSCFRTLTKTIALIFFLMEHAERDQPTATQLHTGREASILFGRDHLQAPW